MSVCRFSCCPQKSQYACVIILCILFCCWSSVFCMLFCMFCPSLAWECLFDFFSVFILSMIGRVSYTGAHSGLVLFWFRVSQSVISSSLCFSVANDDQWFHHFLIPGKWSSGIFTPTPNATAFAVLTFPYSVADCISEKASSRHLTLYMACTLLFLFSWREINKFNLSKPIEFCRCLWSKLLVGREVELSVVQLCIWILPTEILHCKTISFKVCILHHLHWFADFVNCHKEWNSSFLAVVTFLHLVQMSKFSLSLSFCQLAFLVREGDMIVPVRSRMYMCSVCMCFLGTTKTKSMFLVKNVYTVCRCKNCSFVRSFFCV